MGSPINLICQVNWMANSNVLSQKKVEKAVRQTIVDNWSQSTAIFGRRCATFIFTRRHCHILYI